MGNTKPRRNRARLPKEDREEIDKFRRFLEDSKKLTPKELVKKYQEYLGLDKNGFWA